LVLANYAKSEVTIETTNDWTELENARAGSKRRWTLPSRSLIMLQKV
jgi:hypothetical protein